VAPINRRNRPFEATATQNVLDAKRDQGCVSAIVIERVTAGDALNDEPSGFVEAGGNPGFLIAIDSAVSLGQVTIQCISKKACLVQHDRLLEASTDMVGSRSLESSPQWVILRAAVCGPSQLRPSPSVLDEVEFLNE
jgi:hypothetical protein